MNSPCPECTLFEATGSTPQMVGKLDDVVTQPYDKISDSLRRRYLDRSPFNVAHVIVNSDYQAAGQVLGSWISQGALRRDEEPSLYAYQQSYTWEAREYERTGVIGLVSIREAAASIKGHEKTMSGPLQDRLHLLRETEVNDGLIFRCIRNRPVTPTCSWTGLWPRGLHGLRSPMTPVFVTGCGE